LWSNTLVSAGRKWQVVPDGTGGAIFAWNGYKTYRKGLHDDYLYIQRIAPDGTRLWGDEGRLIVASSPFRQITEEEIARGIKGTSTRSRPTYEGQHYIVTDGAGGVIVLWEEDTGNEDDRVYAQRLDGKGNYVWPDMDGAGKTLWARQVFSEESPPNSPVKYLADGKGGIIITYNLQNDSVPRRVMALRLDADGSPSWGEEGIPVFNLPNINYQSIVATFSDGSGRIIVLAVLGKGGLSGDMVYGQRLNINGNRLWGGGIRIDR